MHMYFCSIFISKTSCIEHTYPTLFLFHRFSDRGPAPQSRRLYVEGYHPQVGQGHCQARIATPVTTAQGRQEGGIGHLQGKAITMPGDL